MQKMVEDSKTEEISLPVVFNLITRMAKRLNQFSARVNSETRITPHQYSCLVSLSKAEGMNLTQLAEENKCTRPTITKLVDSLEKKGFATREPHPTDRRQFIVTTTKDGLKTLEKTSSVLKDAFSTCCEVLDPVEIQKLISLLKKLEKSSIFQMAV